RVPRLPPARETIVAPGLDQECGAAVDEPRRVALGLGQPALHEMEPDRRDLHGPHAGRTLSGCQARATTPWALDAAGTRIACWGRRYASRASTECGAVA